MKKFFALLLIPFFPIFIVAQANKTQEIKRINSYVKQITAFVERNPKTLEIYADVSQTDKPKWIKFRSEKTLERFRENTETYTTAYVWRKSRKIVATNFTFSSGSGDWAHYIFYRFRRDGTLAKIEADLRTFYGYMSVARNFYFDKDGKLLRKTINYRDIQTDNLKKSNEDFIDEKIYIFKKVNNLPFARLL